MKVTFFKDEMSTYVPADMMIDISWDELAELLTTFVKVPVKEQTEMYNLWEFKITDNKIHRCKDDCIMLHGFLFEPEAPILFKFDNGEQKWITAKEAVKIVSSWTYKERHKYGTQ